MAIFREVPKCPFCGEIIATAQYFDQSGIPVFHRNIGDDFMGWKHLYHECEEKKKWLEVHKNEEITIDQLLSRSQNYKKSK